MDRSLDCTARSRAGATTKTNLGRTCRTFPASDRRRTLRCWRRSVGRYRRAALGMRTAWRKAPSVPETPHLTISGAPGFNPAFELQIVTQATRSACSAPYCRVGPAHQEGRNPSPRGAWTGPPPSRARDRAEKYRGVKKARKKLLRFEGRAALRWAP